jgi:membrane protease YdiL (CAAX protease family)
MTRPIVAPWQFTIRSLLLALVLVAIACVALLNANRWWASGCKTASFALLTAAILLAVHSGREQRAYWVGFAVAGWVYVLLLAATAFGLSTELITVEALDNLYPLFPWKEKAVAGELSLAFGQGGTMTAQEVVHRNSFDAVGHAFFALIAALLGGTLSQWLYHRRQMRLPGEAL